jgi:hypothetical protein
MVDHDARACDLQIRNRDVLQGKAEGHLYIASQGVCRQRWQLMQSDLLRM